jgi:hypothetical protein
MRFVAKASCPLGLMTVMYPSTFCVLRVFRTVCSEHFRVQMTYGPANLETDIPITVRYILSYFCSLQMQSLVHELCAACLWSQECRQTEFLACG